jgi:predicted transcriptional regulator of viral defense system
VQRTGTYRQRLWDRAIDQFGYVTTQDAIDLQVPPKELPKLAEHAGLEHVAYGLYRFTQVPPTDSDQLAEAVLRVGGDAHITGDTVLVLHDLVSLAPRRVRIGVGRRTRTQVPKWIELHKEMLPNAEITVYDGIRSATVARALVDCRAYMMPSRLREATHAARAKGLLTRREEEAVLSLLAGAK